MIEIIDDIDEAIENCLGRGEFKGLCILLEDDHGVYPATQPTDTASPALGQFRSVKITPDDAHPILIYHRLLDGDFEANEDLSFGRSMAMENRQMVRMVVVASFSESDTLIDQIINALPDTIENDDYKSITIDNSITLIRDRKSIWETEWGNAYKDKYQMRYNIYAVEYSVNYVICQDCVNA